MFALSLQVAIITLLICYDDQRLPEWRYGINMNTLVALLSTVLRAALLVVLAEIIGQAKWQGSKTANGARRGHMTASEAQVFDDATRGAWGSLGLFWKLRLGLRGNALAVLAAVCTTLSIGTGPFAQQAISNYVCDRLAEGKAAHLPVVQYYNGTDLSPGSSDEQQTIPESFSLKLMVASLNGLAHSLDSAVKVECPTGNCTFTQPYKEGPSTLGFCSLCMDSMHLVKADAYGGSSGSALYEFPNAFLDAGVKGANIILPFMSPIGEARGLRFGIDQAEGLKFVMGGDPALPPLDQMSAEFAEAAAHSTINITILGESHADCGSSWERNITAPGCWKPYLYDKALDGYNTSRVDALDREAPREGPRGLGSRPKRYMLGQYRGGYFTAQCALYFCRQDLVSEVRNGKHTEKVIATKPLDNRWKASPPEEILGSAHLIAEDETCVIDGKVYNHANISKMVQDHSKHAYLDMLLDQNRSLSFPTECLYGVEDGFAKTFASFITGLLNTQCNIIQKGVLAFNAEPENCKQRWWLRPISRYGELTLDTVTKDFDGLSKGITNHLRRYGSGPPRKTQQKDEIPGAQGQVWESSVCMRLNWAWLLYPSGLCLITISLQMGILVNGYTDQKTPIWKSSLLPWILYRFNEKPLLPDPNSGQTDLNELEAVARRTFIDLSDGSNSPSKFRTTPSMDRDETDTLLRRKPVNGQGAGLGIVPGVLTVEHSQFTIRRKPLHGGKS